MKTETTTVEVIIKGQQANASLREIQSASRVLNAEFKKLPINSAQFAEKSKELQKVNKRLKSIQDDVKGVGGVFGQISKEVKAFGLIAIAALGFQAITSGVSNLIGQNSKLSDSFADIQKTTGMTEVEVRRLNNAFSQMDTRTSTKDLREIAIAAGQLGIAKKDILSFSSATDKLVVALGDEFTGGAEQVTKEMGGLRKIFSDIKTDKIADDMLHIGNAINVLSASGSATGPVISDFSNRIGGVGIPLGLTSAQVLGLSATLQELNVSTERGGTAITKILMKMTQETDKFAKVAGMSTKDFTDLVNKDLYGAFVKVAEGSKKGGTSATEFSRILDSLGVDGSGASEVFSKLGANTLLLKDKVDLANTSLKGTDSIMNEFNIKNQTFGAKVDKIGKALTTAFVNGPVMKGLNWLADGLVKLTTNTHAVSEAMAEEQSQVELSKIKILSYNIGNEERTKLLKELKEQYPEYLSNLDAEKASNDQVREAIDAVVNSLVNKIVVQRKQEEIAEQAEETADKKEKQLEAETELLQALNRAYKDNDHAYRTRLNNETKLMSKELEGLPVQLQAEELINSKNSGLSRMNENILNVSKALESMKVAEIAYNAESMKGNDIQNEKDELMKRLGIKTPGSVGAVEVPKSTTDSRSEEEIKANQKILDERKKLLEKIVQIEIDFYQKGLDADTKEIADVHEKYSKLLKEAGDFEEEKVRIHKIYSKEIESVLQSQAIEEQKRNAEKLVRLQKLQDEVYVTTLSANDRELVAEMNKWEEIVLKAEQAGLDVTALRQAEADAINAIVIAQGKKEVSEAEKTNDQLSRLQKEKTKKLISAVKDFASRAEAIMEKMDANEKNREDDEIRRNDANLDRDTARYNSELNARVISQGEYDRKIIDAKDAHDKRDAAIKKQAFEREQRAAVSKALINGALGITAIWATYAALPVVAAALTVVEAMAVGAEITAIQSAPQPYAYGGFNKRSNDPQGFTTGPTLYTNSSSGADFIAGEKGTEYIVPNWMVEAPETAPIIEHLETIRQTRSFAIGGNTGVSTRTAKPVFEKVNTTAVNKDSKMLAIQMKRLNDHFDRGITGRWDFDYYNDSLAKVKAAKNASRVG
ncbi:MAG: phage tail tape measure protein [Bacteroidota bacterium]